MNEFDYKKIGLAIKENRKKLKLTQKELGEKIGKTESSIRKYEKGLIQIPNDVLEKISVVFNISVFNLISNTPQEKSSKKSVLEFFATPENDINTHNRIWKITKIIESISGENNNILIENIKKNIKSVFDIELNNEDIENLNKNIQDYITIVITKLLYDKLNKK